MWDTKGRHPGAVTFKHLKDLKRGESKIYPLVSNESSFLCSLSIKVRSHYLPVFSNLFLKCFYILKCKTTSFPVECIILQVYTSFLTASKYSNRQRNELKSIQLVCLPNFSPFFLISVLIINTDKMCDYITLFILILSFKTGSLAEPLWHLRREWALIKSQSDFGGQLVGLLPPDSQSTCLSEFQHTC